MCSTQVYVAGAARALMEIGVFEAIPPSGSIHISELAAKCESDESLISNVPSTPQDMGG